MDCPEWSSDDEWVNTISDQITTPISDPNQQVTNVNGNNINIIIPNENQSSSAQHTENEHNLAQISSFDFREYFFFSICMLIPHLVLRSDFE